MAIKPRLTSAERAELIGSADWPYRSTPLEPLLSVDEALATLTRERLWSLEIPDPAWSDEGSAEKLRLCQAIEALGRAKVTKARDLLLGIYDTHYEMELRLQAGAALLAMADDAQFERAFGRTRQEAVSQCGLFGNPVSQTFEVMHHWVEALLGRASFDPLQGLPRRSPPQPSLDRKVLKQVGPGDYPFPFFHHGMPDELDHWGFVVRFEKPLTPASFELAATLVRHASTAELDCGFSAAWFSFAVADDSFGPGVPTSDYKAFQRSIDLGLLNLHFKRKLPIAWAAKVNFGNPGNKGDDWHKFSVARAKLDKLIMQKPEIAWQARPRGELPSTLVGRLWERLYAEPPTAVEVRAWLAEGLSPRGADPMRNTPLHVAAKLNPPQPELLALLLSEGAQVDARDACQRTALHCAARVAGSTAGVRLLLEAGADPRAADVHQLTVLHRACMRDDLELLRLLVAAGADLQARDRRGRTPIQLLEPEAKRFGKGSSYDQGYQWLKAASSLASSSTRDDC